MESNFVILEMIERSGYEKVVSVCNVGNDCLINISTRMVSIQNATPTVAEALTFVPCVNIDCSVEPRVLKSTGFNSTINNFQMNSDKIMIGDLAKFMNELNEKLKKEAEVQEVE